MVRFIFNHLIILCFLHGCVSQVGNPVVQYEIISKENCADLTQVIETIYTLSLLGCAMMSQAKEKKSFNFVSSGSTNGTCEIHASHYEVTKFAGRRNCNYYEMARKKEQLAGDVDLCLSNPCFYKRRCIVNETPNGHFCDCNLPTGGVNCSEGLICDKCSSQNDLVIYLFNNETVDWSVARDRCVTMGYQLHMPRTEAIFNFTRNILLGMYKYNFQKQHAYWIGLSRVNESSNWVWVDGTDLGSFHPWGRPQTKDCAEMANSPNYNFTWDDAYCVHSSKDPWSKYFICEKYYDYLL